MTNPFDVIKQVEMSEGIKPGGLIAKDRMPHVVQARKIAIRLCRQLTLYSCAELARHFDRDRSYISKVVNEYVVPTKDEIAILNQIKEG